MGDSKTIVGHPWSTTHLSMTIEERLCCGVTEDLVRISAGTENVNDIIDDLCQSLHESDCMQHIGNEDLESRLGETR